jgi:CheY-like chemotaxis protein
MSHEIRTPLNVILGTLELLKSTTLTPEQEPLLLTCQRASHMLMVLINDILDFSKSQTGELELKNLEFNLRETFGNTCAMMAVQAQGKELSFSHSFSPELPDWVVGDADRLMQIMVNLIANAIKFTHQGEVRVTAEPDPDAGDQRVGVRLRVSDTGIGIAPDKQEIIFAGFQQADKSVSRLYGGTGLGLAITKSLVSKMDGDIAVQSAPGQGSTFTITLRFGRAAAPASAPTAEPAPAATPMPALRILVAEDTYDNRMLLQSFLRHTNHALDFAFNGRDACTRFQTQPYDLILMDMEMPEMNGLDATAEIRACERRENRPPTPIIALTAHSFSEEREKCLAAGCSDFLSKPFKRQMLLDKLRQHARPTGA